MKKYLLLLATTIIIFVGISYFSSSNYGCGFEGCMSRAGLPFNFFVPDGIGQSYISYPMVLIDFVIVFVVIFIAWSLISIFTQREG